MLAASDMLMARLRIFRDFLALTHLYRHRLRLNIALAISQCDLDLDYSIGWGIVTDP
jgi:hypothetical protein